MNEIVSDPILSKIVNIIDKHNDDIPEGDYLAIMNRLKMAFQNKLRVDLPQPRNDPQEETKIYLDIQINIKEAILNIQHWMLYFNGSPNQKITEYNMKILEDINSYLNQLSPGYIPQMYVPIRTTDQYMSTIINSLFVSKDLLNRVKFYNFISRNKQLELIQKIYAVGRFFAQNSPVVYDFQ